RSPEAISRGKRGAPGKGIRTFADGFSPFLPDEVPPPEDSFDSARDLALESCCGRMILYRQAHSPKEWPVCLLATAGRNDDHPASRRFDGAHKGADKFAVDERSHYLRIEPSGRQKIPGFFALIHAGRSNFN